MTPWEKHKKDWLQCRRCSLCDSRTNVVLLRGKIPCDVLFVGEAPGASEDVLAQPFKGPAGHLLDEIVSRARATTVPSNAFDEMKIAFTNLVGCLPTDESGSKNGEPPDEAIKKCGPRLRELVTMCSPRLIVWVGKLSAKWGPKVLAEGTKSYVANYNTVEIVHPAFILRADESQKGLAIQRTVITLADAFEELT